MNLEEMIKLFLDSRKRGTSGAHKRCAPRTLEIYEKNVRDFMDFLAGLEKPALRYEDVRRLHIVQFLDLLDKREKDKLWSRATTLQTLRCLRCFFRWVEKDEDCQELGLKPLHRYLPVIEAGPSRDFLPTNKEVKEFMNNFDVGSVWKHRNYVAFSLMFDTGMRIGELSNLKLANTKLDEKTLIADGKTGPRIVPVTNEIVKLLRVWLKRRERCRHAKDSPYMFISRNKPMISAHSLTEAFIKHRKDFGLAHITPHTLRHAFCTHYLKNGGGIDRLKNITGHTTFSILNRYLHTAKVSGNQAAEELERVSPLKGL